jgi:hypothetical protein
MARETIVIDVDIDNGKITAHAEGIKSKDLCLKAIMELIEDMLDEWEGGYIRDEKPTGGQKTRWTWKRKNVEKN